MHKNKSVAVNLRSEVCFDVVLAIGLVWNQEFNRVISSPLYISIMNLVSRNPVKPMGEHGM